MPVPVLQFQDVSLSYESQRGAVKALRDLHLEVCEGEFVSVVGPSGCGKSTLLNIACGILPASTGEVLLHGRRVRSIVQERVGYVFQTDAILPWQSVFENIALALRLQHRPESEIQTRVMDWIERVGLGGFHNHYPHQLSGGMRKRVAIAQALVHEPELLLMDEPFSALDVQTRNLMENELLRIWDALRTTVLFITHDLEEAIALSDRVVVMTARPATVKSTYPIGIPRPREITEIRLNPLFHELYGTIWNDLREEVHSAYEEAQRGK
ncbi:MAG: ABC transporter ATP-binding protein [Bacillota bacterium]